MDVTGILNYRGNYGSGLVATNDKDVHNAFLFTYALESFVLILETNCRFSNISDLPIMLCRYIQGDTSRGKNFLLYRRDCSA